MRKIYSLITRWDKLSRVKIDNSLKSKIKRSWLKILFLNRYVTKNKVTNIVGYKVRYLDRQLLSYLYSELFVNNDYYFNAENEVPYIIDCGSNIGMSIFYFKMLYPKSQILAFEPGEEAFNCLEENIKNNGLDQIALNKSALSNKEGIIDFYYDQENVGSLTMSSKQERMSKDTRKVNAILLSKFIDKEVDFLKLDIEGAELDVIEDLSDTGKLNYVKQMVIEYHHHIVKDEDDFSKILSLLENAGFGYQIEGHLVRPLNRKKFQDILVYAYRK